MATLEQNINRAVSVFDRVVANIEAKGVPVPAGITVEGQADKILDISGAGEIESTLGENGYEELIQGYIDELNYAISLKGEELTWSQYKDNRVKGICIIDPADALVATSAISYRPNLRYIGENVDFSQLSSCNDLVQYNVNLQIFKPCDFSAASSFKNAFVGCFSLRNIDIYIPVCGDISNFASNGCESLRRIKIETDRQQIICGNAFRNCTDLKSIEFVNGIKTWKDSEVSNTLQYFMHNCPELESVAGIIDVMGNTSFNNPFAGLQSLTEIRIANISTGGISFRDSPLLSQESVIFMGENLIEYTSGSRYIHFNSDTMDNMTDETKELFTSAGYIIAS